jgi:hypothetical protein
MARSAGFRNLVEYEPVDGETLARVMVDGQAKPLAHARQEGKGRIVYLATSEDIGLVRSVVDAMAGAAPAAPTPAGSQVVLTRQPQKKRWVLHLLADGDYTIDIDSRFATPAGVAERYPQAGWSASVEKTAKGIRIRVSGGASDRLLALE